MTHKPLSEQVIVIAGASSGIGLATARMAAERDARVVMAARSGEALARIQAGIGGKAIHVVAGEAFPPAPSITAPPRSSRFRSEEARRATRGAPCTIR